MKPLSPADAQRLETAQTALRQEQTEVAQAAWDQIDPECRLHPQVLEVQWELLARACDWGAALEVARLQCEIAPEEESVWMSRAYCLHELKRVPEAYTLMLEVAERFPASPAVAYSLTCCSCKLGKIDEAKRWLQRTVDLGGRAGAKIMGLEDPDLAPLWPQICSL